MPPPTWPRSRPMPTADRTPRNCRTLSPLAREVYLRFMLDQVDDAADRQALEAALGDAVLDGERPAPGPALRDALRLMRRVPSRPAHRPQPRRGGEPRGSTARGGAGVHRAISPIRHLALAADVHLMHETEDHHVPFTETRASHRPWSQPGCSASTPSSASSITCSRTMSIVAALPELVKLLLHVRALMEATL